MRSTAYAVVQRDYMQHVEQLALVFVDALDLDIKQRIRVDRDIKSLLNDFRELYLVDAFDRTERVAELGIVGQFAQLGQLTQVAYPAFADTRSNQSG